MVQNICNIWLKIYVIYKQNLLHVVLFCFVSMLSFMWGQRDKRKCTASALIAVVINFKYISECLLCSSLLTTTSRHWPWMLKMILNTKVNLQRFLDMHCFYIKSVIGFWTSKSQFTATLPHYRFINVDRTCTWKPRIVV